MPIYEYQCGKCGTFEASQRITEAALRRCPTCKGKVTKLISHTSFQLKGSGWYVTDYASKGAGGEKSGGEASKTDSSGTEASKDSKDAKDSKASKSAKDGKDAKTSSDSSTKTSASGKSEAA